MVMLDLGQRGHLLYFAQRGVVILTETHRGLDQGGLKEVRLVYFENMGVVAHFVKHFLLSSAFNLPFDDVHRGFLALQSF